jgi:serine/threonine protein kinase
VRGLVDISGTHNVDHSTFVFSNPPLETGPPAQAKAHELTIVGEVSHTPKRKGGGPRLASCYLDSDQARCYVAKIYDALEYRLADAGDGGCDCMYLADMDYGREAAAYQAIPARFQGDIVPRYFGSWTFSLQSGRGASALTRPVRMILPELIHGETILDMLVRAMRSAKWPDSIDFSALPPEKERLEILGRAVEAELALSWYAGVVHNDFSPRNIMVARNADNRQRVVLIDFNLARVGRYTVPARQPPGMRDPTALPISPIERHWPGYDFTSRCEFGGWVPMSWHESNEVSNARALEWLVSLWKGSPKYQPLSDEFFEDETNEVFGENVQRYVALLKSEQAQRHGK